MPEALAEHRRACTAPGPRDRWRFCDGGRRTRSLVQVLIYRLAEQVRPGAMRIVIEAFEPAPPPVHLAPGGFPSSRAPRSISRASFVEVGAP
jgi:hypothetical protein